MAARDQRFVRTYVQSGLRGSMELWVDRETGVNYIYRGSDYGGGLTPLLNPDGTPVVTHPEPED